LQECDDRLQEVALVIDRQAERASLMNLKSIYESYVLECVERIKQIDEESG
jgi:hypothetical protein